MSFRLQARDTEIVRTLCLNVRLISVSQAAETWWEPTEAGQGNARRRLRRLAESGLVALTTVIAHPVSALLAPVVSWSPGDPEPNCGAVAWQLQRRWRDPVRSTTTYLATRRAASLFGGRANGKLKHRYQATHDLGVTAIYLQLKRTRPDLAEHWIGEDLLAPYRRKQKLPDAVVADHPGTTPSLVLEFGGAYDKQRVKDFHHDCERRALAYEIW